VTIISQLIQNRKTVLVVDDDPFVSEFVRMTLMRLGYAARIADNGLTGLATAVKERPDAILLDLAMPELDGFEFLKHKNRMPEIDAIPVLVLSASHTRTDVKRAMALGACGYITKPVTEDALAKRLGKFVPSPLFGRPETTQLVWGNMPPKSLL
jgi:CheY-like chemotaxis protein